MIDENNDLALMRNKNQSVSSGYDDSGPLSEWGTDPTITQTDINQKRWDSDLCAECK
jgi:hypothetical protein